MIYKKIACLLCFVVLCSQYLLGQPKIRCSNQMEAIGGSVEILTDSNSNISLQQAISSGKYHPSESDFPNLGITPYAYWIRFKLENVKRDSKLAILLQQPMIDKVEFYQLDSSYKVIKNNVSGQLLPFSSRPVQYQSYIYPVSISSGGQSTFYLHISSGKQLVLPIYAGSLPAVVVSATTADILFGIYTGVILVMLLYNLFIYITVRDISYLYYVGYLLIVIVTQACLEGYLFRFVLPNYPALV